MDAIPPSIWHAAAEVRHVADDCTRTTPCLRVDDAHDQHDVDREHEHVPEVVEATPTEDLPPGRQMLDIPQRAWREQAKERWRTAVQTVQRTNRSASAE
jgi:hypothetical protein